MGAGRVSGLVCLVALGAAGCGERALARGDAPPPPRETAEPARPAPLQLEAPLPLVSAPAPAAASKQAPVQAHKPRLRVRPMTVVVKATAPEATAAPDETEAAAEPASAEQAKAEEQGLYASQIQQAILADPQLADEDIEVTIVDDMVLLTGKVGDRGRSEAATALAVKALEGKLPVSNRLMLRR